MSPQPEGNGNNSELTRLANAVKAAAQDFESLTEAINEGVRELEEKRLARATALKALNAARIALQAEAAK
jgi:Arc/MetJ-type ribon-helix-helix transcriptional regulator